MRNLFAVCFYSLALASVAHAQGTFLTKDEDLQRIAPAVENLPGCTAFYARESKDSVVYRVTAGHCVGNRYGIYTKDPVRDIAVSRVPEYTGHTLLLSEVSLQKHGGHTACAVGSPAKRAHVGVPCGTVEEHKKILFGAHTASASGGAMHAAPATELLRLKVSFPESLRAVRGTRPPILGMSGSPLVVCAVSCVVIGVLTHEVVFPPGSYHEPGAPTLFARVEDVRALIHAVERAHKHE